MSKEWFTVAILGQKRLLNYASCLQATNFSCGMQPIAATRKKAFLRFSEPKRLHEIEIH